MDKLDLVGLHYSSAKPPNPSWMAWGSERSGALHVDGVEHVGATVPERLAKGPPRVLGIDAPFGVPTGLARALVPLVTNGSQILEHLSVAPSALLDAAWATYATENPGALRLTDALSHGAHSITGTKPPLWRTLRALARVLWSLRDRVSVVPFDALELSPARPMVLEVLPAVTLRLLGLPYALHHATPEALTAAGNTAVTAERLRVVAGLGESVSALGARVELSPHVANACAQDTSGDAIDALIALVAVFLATRGVWSPPPLTGPAATRALVEGWIVRPA